MLNLKLPVVVMGMGETGRSVAEYLSRQHIPFTLLDTRKTPPQLDTIKLMLKSMFSEVPIYTENFPPEVIQQAKTIILSPGIPKTHPAIYPYLSKEAEVIGDIEIFARDLKAPLIAITGSNGKSTVTTLVGDMAKKAGLEVAVGGNLGTPALELLMNFPKSSLFVLEMSSFQLENTYSLKPFVSTILNISPDHLDRYQHFENYLQAKLRIFQNASQIVYNRDESRLIPYIPTHLQAISFGLSKPDGDNFGILQSQGHSYLAKGSQSLLKISELKLFGNHNVSNALAALALGEAAHLPMESMLEALKEFQGLAHRCEWVRDYNNVIWINDSKGTNVGATIASVQGLANVIAGKWILIAGGVSKNADFRPLAKVIPQYCRAAVLIGESQMNLKKILEPYIPCFLANSLEQAVTQAKQLAQPGEGVLLSPACASFDMFQNYEERGKAFKQAVRSL